MLLSDIIQIILLLSLVDIWYNETVIKEKGMARNFKNNAITSKRDEDFAQWYTDICKAED